MRICLSCWICLGFFGSDISHSGDRKFCHSSRRALLSENHGMVWVGKSCPKCCESGSWGGGKNMPMCTWKTWISNTHMAGATHYLILVEPPQCSGSGWDRLLALVPWSPGLQEPELLWNYRSSVIATAGLPGPAAFSECVSRKQGEIHWYIWETFNCLKAVWYH